MARRSATSFEALSGAAQVAEDQEDWTELKRLSEQLIQLQPEDVQANFWLAAADWHLGLQEEAVARWSTLQSEEDGDVVRARFLAGTELWELGQPARAEAVLREGLGHDPEHLSSLELLLDIYLQQLRRDELLDTLSRIRSIRPLSVRELATELLAGRSIISPDRGLATTERWLEADPGDVSSAIARVRYLLELDQASEAFKLTDSLTSDATENSQGRVQAARAIAALSIGDVSAAVDAANALILTTASTSVEWEAYGRVALRLGEDTVAALALQRAAQVAPFDVEIQFQWATALERSGDSQSADIWQHSRDIDELEREAFMLLDSDRYAPQLVADTIAVVVQRLMRIGQPLAASDWVRAGLQLVPGHRELSTLDGPVSEMLAIADADLTDIEPIPELPRLTFSATANDATAAVGAARSIQFVDVAQQSGIQFQYDNGAAGLKRIIETIGGGVAVLDYDNDGWPDLYFPQGGPLPDEPRNADAFDRLYRNLGDGTFRDVTRQAGLEELNYSQGCAVGDFDNDGDPDLLVANVGRNTFHENLGDGTFRSVHIAGVTEDEDPSSSVAFGDLNGDGLLDIYVVNYISDWTRVCYNSQGIVATCNPHSLAAAQDRVYCNRGDGTFADVTREAGFIAAEGKGLGIVISDFDADGRQDVYVANDGTPNFLFQNIGEGLEFAFRESGLLAGVAVSGEGRAEAGMGIAAADLNQDLKLDLFVTNFFQEPNRLYLNQGDGVFGDATRQSSLDQSSRDVLGFGTQAADFDGDGDADLIVANGDIDDYSAVGRPWKMPPQVFENLGNGRFADISDSAGAYFEDLYLGRGVARLDFNRDGRIDVAIVHQDRPVALLENTTSTVPRTLPTIVTLVGTDSNRDAVGSRLIWSTGELRILQQIEGGNGFMASNERTIFLPNVSSEIPGTLVVEWSSGISERFDSLPAGYWLLQEGCKPLRLLR